jgi:NAD(P)-dependent dehydrogenase (short-subunit alcohol dehydrogenase family)
VSSSPTALVTGAAGGIGWATARRLAADGMTVTVVDRKPLPDHVAAHSEITYIHADLTDAEVPLQACKAATRDGTLDYLVNAAGVSWFDRDGSILEMTEQTWTQVLAINLEVTRRMTVAAVPLLRLGAGRAIVHIASIAGLKNMDSPLDAYQVSKAAVVSMSRSLAIQLGPEGIRSNTVCPGAILTPMIEPLYEQSPQRRAAMEQRTPLRRIGTPEDIAAAVAFLLSDQASFITGTDLVVDGGWTAQIK